jgi:quercetin dioxygenase-like cupin family protein
MHAPGGGSREVWLPWHVVGRAAIKASAIDTEGRFSQIEFDDSRGTSPPLHVHHNGDESFYVIEGDIEVVCDGMRMLATSGDYVLIPRGQAHSYVVTSERARLLTTFAPAGVEEYFVTYGVPVVAGEPPPAPSNRIRTSSPPSSSATPSRSSDLRWRCRSGGTGRTWAAISSRQRPSCGGLLSGRAPPPA